MEDVRSGGLNIREGKFRNAGIISRNWSARVYSSTGAYDLDLNGLSIVNPSNADNNWYSIPFRCLSTV